MERFFKSLYRITTRASFLAIALMLGLALYYLPTFLHLDGFRPEVIDLLEKTFRCKAVVGNITGELVPYPGLVVGHVVLMEDSSRPRVLASVNAVHVWFSPRTLSGRLHVRMIRFLRPRFILHREEDSQGDARWTLLTLPGAQPFIGPRPAPGSELTEEWQIRNGSFEIWDHTTAPVTKWTADRFTGSFRVRAQTGSLTGKVSPLGRRAALNIRYNGNSAYPIEAHLNNIALESIQSLVHMKMTTIEGRTDLNLKARFQPALSVQADIEPVSMVRLKGIHLYGRAALDGHHLQAHLQTDTTAPMTLALEGDFRRTRWNFQASVQSYDARWVRELYDQSWVNRLEGPGSIAASGQSGTAAETWGWAAVGKDFGFAGTPLQIPEWSAKGDAQNTTVYVRAKTSEGGTAEVVWFQSAALPDANLQVDVATMTIHQVLEVFNLQHQPAAGSAPPSAESMNPYGYEPWMIRQGSMQAIIRTGKRLEVTESDFDVAGMHLDLTGVFDLVKSSPQAHMEGDLRQVPVAPVVESFFKPPSPITGTGQINFTLNFPLSSRWMEGFSGPLELQIDKGIVKLFKTVYRIVSALNLTNYLRLRFPQVTAQGIEFNSLVGHLHFQNGVAASDDLFLKSPNMNVGAKGSLDIPARRVDCRLRVEMFRFLEDILRDVPITHWIFKKPNKILLPLVVSVEGPWDNVEVH